jgi:hypothetical protein
MRGLIIAITAHDLVGPGCCRIAYPARRETVELWGGNWGRSLSAIIQMDERELTDWLDALAAAGLIGEWQWDLAA